MDENSGWKGVIGIGIIILLVWWLLQKRWGRAVLAGCAALFCYLAFSGHGDSYIDHKTPEGMSVAITGWIIFLIVTAIAYVASIMLEKAAINYNKQEEAQAQKQKELHLDKLDRTKKYFLDNIKKHSQILFEDADAFHREMAYFLYDNDEKSYMPWEWMAAIGKERGETYKRIL